MTIKKVGRAQGSSGGRRGYFQVVRKNEGVTQSPHTSRLRSGIGYLAGKFSRQDCVWRNEIRKSPSLLLQLS